MRSSVIGVLVLLSAAGSARAQGSDGPAPIDSGMILPPASQDRVFGRVIYTNDTFSFSMQSGVGQTILWSVEITVVTSGPSVLVSVNVPLSTFSLVDGQILSTDITVNYNSGSVSGQSTRDTMINPVDSRSTSMAPRRREELEEPCA
jgi:hypothetical protein